MSSYGLPVTLTCPAAHQYQATAWRIIDFGEHPELLEPLRGGSLAMPPCTECGRRDSIFAEPLLLFFPDRHHPLVLSPFVNLQGNKLQQTVNGYVGYFRESMGERWRDEWVLEPIPVILRPKLPKFLDSYLRDDEPLSQLMLDALLAQQRYSETGDSAALDETLEVFERALRHPELPEASEEIRFSVYGGSAEFFRNRYRRQGDDADFERALESLDMARQLHGFAGEINEIHGLLLLDRHDRSSDFGELSEAVMRLETSVTIPSKQTTANVSVHLACARAWRLVFNETNLPLAIDRSIALLRDAVTMAASDADRDKARNRLGDALDKRHQRFMSSQDAEEALALFGAVIESSHDEEQLQLAYNGRGCVRLDRFTREGAIDDLRAAVPDLRRAVQTEPASPGLHATYLIDLGNGLRSLYELEGDPRLLEEAIDSQLKSATVSQANDLDPSVALLNLGILLTARYTASGSLTDLNEAIGHLETVMEETPAGSQHEASVRINLGVLLCERYKLMFDASDLERSLDVLRAVPHVAILEERLRPSLSQALGMALLLEFRRTHNPDHLDNAVASLSDAVQTTTVKAILPSAHAQYAAALMERYEISRGATDLDDAIASARRARILLPAESPRRPSTLLVLAQCLEARANANNDDDASLEALSLYRQAAQEESDAPTVLTSAGRWARIAFLRGDWADAVEAYERLFAARAELLATQTGRSEKEAWLRSVQGTAADAAYAFARMGALPRAAEALENGAAILLAEALRTTDRDEQRLRGAGFGDLVDQYTEAAAEWRAVMQPPPTIPGASDLLLAARRIDDSRESLENVLARIRAIAGYENFRAPTSIADLHQTAKELGGPLVYLATTHHSGVAILVTPGEVRAVWLPLSDQRLTELLFRNAEDGTFVGYHAAQLGLPQSIDSALAELLPLLEEQVIAPLRSELRAMAAERIALIPTAQLALLPIAALLSDAVCVAVQANARSLERALLSGRDAGGGPALIVGNPLPSPEPLHAAELEARIVAAHFPSPFVFIGVEVDRTAVLDALRTASHVHLACHGSSRLGDALDSALFLGGSDRLTVRDLLFGDALPRQARLVVLSACQSAIPDSARLPDEAAGLPTAFIEAGVPAVVGTLWPVDDWSTALLMDRFYRHYLVEKQRGTDALRKAQQWLRTITAGELADYFRTERQQPDAELKAPYEILSAAWRRFAALEPNATPFESPVYWAPFVHYGV